MQLPAPIALDLDEAMPIPTMIAAGAVGGLGNANFVSRADPRPKYATTGEAGLSMTLHLELKITGALWLNTAICAVFRHFARGESHPTRERFGGLALRVLAG